MKLADATMDYMMEDLPMERANSTPLDDTVPSNQNTFLRLTPMSGPSEQSTAPRSRRTTVSMACERCRKRKIKCSDLPGPCSNCGRLNVPCYEPGKRKGSAQSTLEERIQRLRRLAAVTHVDQQDHQTRMMETQGFFNNLSVDPIQTPIAEDSTFGGSLSASTHGFPDWTGFDNPASYFGSHTQQTQNWALVETPDEDMTSLRYRPHLPLETTPTQTRYRDSRGALSDSFRNSRIGLDTIIPTPGSILTQNSASQASPGRHAETPLGFTISHDPTLYNDSDSEHEADQDDSHATSPSSTEHAPLPTRNAYTLADPRPTAVSQNALDPPNPSPTTLTQTLYRATSHNLSRPSSLGQPLTRSQTVPASQSNLSSLDTFLGTGLLSLIVRSEDTRKYVRQYFAKVHSIYPFLDPAMFESELPRVEQLSEPKRESVQQQAFTYFQILLVAAIGALVQYESTTLSSQYVQQAIGLQQQIELWNSVGGIHCALLLSLYCYLAQIMVYDTRQDESAESERSHTTSSRPNRYPVSNLWLHNCQIAAACIDLGMHQPLAMQEQIRSRPDLRTYLEVCRNTFRSAYMLDRRVSDLRNRPRAFHDGDIDQTLLINLGTES